MSGEVKNISNTKIAGTGALITVAVIFVYASLVTVCVVVRSSSFIFSAMPEGERAGILWANGLALAYSVWNLLMIVLVVWIYRFHIKLNLRTK
jgi:hypothetical protein